jgi:hypothetical protein
MYKEGNVEFLQVSKFGTHLWMPTMITMFNLGRPGKTGILRFGILRNISENHQLDVLHIKVW